MYNNKIVPSLTTHVGSSSNTTSSSFISSQVRSVSPPPQPRVVENTSYQTNSNTYNYNYFSMVPDPVHQEDGGIRRDRAYEPTDSELYNIRQYNPGYIYDPRPYTNDFSYGN